MAALNFPANPSNGDEFEGYVYDSTLGVWNRKPSTVAYTVSPNAPTNPNDGDVWFNEQDGSSYIYYVDTDSEQWIEIGGKVGATGAAGQDGADGSPGRFINSATKPLEPVDGDVWFNTNNGKIFVYYNDGNTSQWVESGNPMLGYNTLENLSDTNITSPTDGQALVYNASTSKWIPGDVSVDVYDVPNSSTGYLSIPKGTTAQRPSSPSDGDIRFNTDTGEPEWYSSSSSEWISFRSPPPGDVTVEYLIVAGGASGAASDTSFGGGGGGGAGGLLNGSTTLSSPASFTVTLGAGGAAITAAQAVGSNGSNTLALGLTAVGGGGGGANSSGLSGGSGGGAYGYPHLTYSGGAGTVGQGNAGGFGDSDNVNYTNSGGGGGAGGVGGNATSSAGGAGGDGAPNTITGVAQYYAGGGGGGFSVSGGQGGIGGQGGGGDGADAGVVGSSGLANTGGGGGGGSIGSPYSSGAGGSGLFIIKYPDNKNLSIGNGLVASTVSGGGYKITTFTAGTDTVTLS